MKKNDIFVFIAFIMALGLLAVPLSAQTMEEQKSGEMSSDAANAYFSDGYQKGFAAGLQQGRTEAVDQTGEVRGYQEPGETAVETEEMRDDRSDLQRFYDNYETTGGKWENSY